MTDEQQRFVRRLAQGIASRYDIVSRYAGADVRHAAEAVLTANLAALFELMDAGQAMRDAGANSPDLNARWDVALKKFTIRFTVPQKDC